MSNKIYNGIMGLVVGDAMGVPYEFCKRGSFRCKGIVGFGTYNQPPGTWSDDSSMTIATLDSLIKNDGTIDLEDMMKRFCDWYHCGQYTPYNRAFDVGNTTSRAILKYDVIKNNIYNCGCKGIKDNGNGSLMRILPLAFIECTAEEINQVSALTHAHEISKLSCNIYVAIAKNLLNGMKKKTAVEQALNRFELSEHKEFKRLKDIKQCDRNEIYSDGYVVHTLEAALWCFLNANSYRHCVLTAVNLGSDTDTVAAVAGGLAGIYYGVGFFGIPIQWINLIAREEWIKDLCEDFDKMLEKSS